MSNDKNIENFDSFFKDAFNSFEPTPPKGVFEAVQSQVGASAGTGAAGTTTTVAKVGAWGVGKIIIGAVGAIAVATTVYLSVNSSDNSTTNNQAKEQNTGATTQIISPDIEKEESTNTISETQLQNTTKLDEADAKVNNQTESSLSISSANNSTLGVTEQSSNSNTGNIKANNETSSTINGGEESSANNSKVNKEIVGMYLSGKQLCANERLTITIADDLAKKKYKVDFGDGQYAITKIGKPTTHIYKSGGRYKVTAKEIGGNKETVEQWVDVRNVHAKFEAVLVEKSTYKFNNLSKNAVHYNWFFGDKKGVISQNHSPSYTFKSFKPESYRVKLIAMDNVGCLDSFSTVIKKTYNYEDIKPKLYNVFSPGTDGRNDHYEIDIQNEEKYHLVVLDKNGNKVFESFDKEKTWDGKNIYNGENCLAGSYVVVFTYKIKGFEQQQEKVFVTLVR